MFSLPIPTTQPGEPCFQTGPGRAHNAGRGRGSKRPTWPGGNIPGLPGPGLRPLPPDTPRRVFFGFCSYLSPGWGRGQQRGSSRAGVQLREECGEEKVTYILNRAGRGYRTGFSSWDTAQGIPTPAGELAISG